MQLFGSLRNFYIMNLTVTIFYLFFFSFYQGALKDRQGRLITVTSTVTAFTYATATVTVATTQSLVFSSKALFCFPSNLVSSLSIKAC